MKKKNTKLKELQITLSEDINHSELSPSNTSSNPSSKSSKKSEKKKFSFPIYRRFFQYTINRGKQALLCLILTLLSGFVIAIFPWKVGVVLDLVTEVALKNEVESKEQLSKNLYELGGLILLKGIFTFLRFTRMQLLQQKLAIDIKTNIYEIFIKFDLYFFEKHKTGELISRLTSDINQAKSAISNNLALLVRNILTVIGNIIILIMMSWKLSLCVLLLVPIYVIVGVHYTKKSKQLIRKRQDIMAEMTSHVAEKFNGIQVVKSFCSEQKQINKYQQINEEVYGVNWTRTMYQGLNMTVSTVLPSISILLVLWYGGYLLINGKSDLSPGQLTAFIMYCSSISSTTSAISGSYTNIINGTQSCQKIFQMMEYEPLVDEEAGQEVEIDGSVHFDHVSFSYPSTEVQIFNNLSFEIKKGEYVAFVGQSGSGKSTVVKLIERFYKLNEGSIYFGDINSQKIKIKHLRQQIGLVSQEATIFSGTVEENITYGLKDYNIQDLEKVIQQSGCTQFLSNERLFPKGFQTIIGERGSTLSGGQRQRISIARVLMHKPKILIFDEATSALDSHSQDIVQKSIEKLAKEESGITIVVVAHRLSTVINCNKLFVMRDGNIVETGNHSDLIGKGGYYYDLIQKQLHEKS